MEDNKVEDEVVSEDTWIVKGDVSKVEKDLWMAKKEK